MSFKNGFLAIAMMSGLSLVACSNTAAGVKKDTEINAEKTAAAADKAGEKTAEAADKAAEKTAVAADKAAEAGHEAAAATKEMARDASGAMKAAAETVDVKSALMADTKVDASHIDVDTYKETKTVVLRGSVKTAGERAKAASIAAAKAPGYRIDNQLKVVANP